MPASALTFYQDFKEQLGLEVHNLNTDTFRIALTNAAPNVATHTVLADITQLGSGGGYTGGAGGGFALDSVSYTESGGVGTFDAATEIFTAAGGTVGPFRYAVLYNDTSASDNLVGYYDYGSSITLNDTETFTITISTNIFTVT